MRTMPRGYGAGPRSGLPSPRSKFPGASTGTGTGTTDDPSILGVPRSQLRGRFGEGAGGPIAGNGIVGHGLAAAGLVLAAGVASALTALVQTERNVLDRLLIFPHTQVDDLRLLQFLHNNDPLISGQIPGGLFAPDSLWNPPIMRRAEVSDPVQVSLISTAGTTAYPMISAHTGAESQALPPAGYRPGIFDPGPRRIIAMGPAAQQSIAAGATAVVAIPIVEDAILDRLILEGQSTSTWNVAGISYDNDPAVGTGQVLPGTVFARNSWGNPRLGWLVRRAHNLLVTITNTNGAGGPYTLDLCVTCR